MGDVADMRPSRETNEAVRRAGASSIVRPRIDEPDHEPKSQVSAHSNL